MSNHVTITDFNRASLALTWAKTNCPTYITVTGNMDPETFEYSYRFFFLNTERGHQEATVFALKFSG